MKQLLLIIMFLTPTWIFASGNAHVKMIEADNDLADTASLQRGAKYYVNYCLGCHSLKYMRYSRMGKDLNLSDEDVVENLMFTAEKIGNTMDIAMSEEDAKSWFGTLPPDLTVVSRSRGTDWLKTYLHGFYKDEARPFGYNNTVFKDVGMPHILVGLQGEQEAVYKEINEHGKTLKVIDELKISKPGTMSAEAYNELTRDLVNFLEYTGEPAKLYRQQLGVKVLIFLAIFFVFALLLKKEYWKDIH